MPVEQIPKPAAPSSLSESDMRIQVFHYSPWRYLRTILAIVWAAFAHPFSTTVIDLATGEVRHNTGKDEP